MELLDKPLWQRAYVQGFLFDHSRVVRCVLAGREVVLSPEQECAFREEIQVVSGMDAIPFEVEDAAGNVTRGKIALAAIAQGQHHRHTP